MLPSVFLMGFSEIVCVSGDVIHRHSSWCLEYVSQLIWELSVLLCLTLCYFVLCRGPHWQLLLTLLPTHNLSIQSTHRTVRRNWDEWSLQITRLTIFDEKKVMHSEDEDQCRLSQYKVKFLWVGLCKKKHRKHMQIHIKYTYINMFCTVDNLVK